MSKLWTIVYGPYYMDHFHKSWINSNEKMIRFEIDILPHVEFYILKEF